MNFMRMLINSVMIVDINTHNNLTEVSYKIIDFRKCTRIDSFIYSEQNEIDKKYTYEWFLKFFSRTSVVFTIGELNKRFIKQFVYNVYDLYSDDVCNIMFPRYVHIRRSPLTSEFVKNWKNPSKCPASKCRYSHSGPCSFKNIQCMIEWLNDPIF